MRDLIERPAAQTELMMKCERYTLARESHGMGHVEWSSDLISVADAMDAIRDLPSAQPEIIRCKDCFYGYCEVWLTGGGEATSHGYCGRTNLRVLPYDFCSKAERRTDEDD